MTPFKTLHKGFDGLDMAIKGALRAPELELLEDAKKTTEKAYQPTLIKLGPGQVAMHVADTGAKGGYAFRCDTGPMGETWFFKRNQSASDWNIRVSAKSLPLAILGYKGVRDQIRTRLADMGAIFGEERLGRLDYAIDLLMPAEFSLQPDQFVAHSKTKVAEHNYPVTPTSINPDEFQVHWAGRQASSVTIGKMPGRQIIIYDKRREVIQKYKRHWFSIWDIDPTDKNYAVWRVEVRAGKKYLRFWHIKDFADLENQFGDLVVAAVQDIRYVVDSDQCTNITRIALNPLWKRVQEELAIALGDFRSGIVPDNIIRGERERILTQYKSQITALLPGALIANGFSEREAEQEYAAFFMELAKAIETGGMKEFRKKLARASSRLHFI